MQSSASDDEMTKGPEKQLENSIVIEITYPKLTAVAKTYKGVGASRRT